MSGYTKNIAVIRAIKSGFSSDGGALSGLVKAEKYGSYFRTEVALINFAPLTSGRYVACIGDGVNFVAFDGPVFEGESDIDSEHGFAALVCYAGTEVVPVASAVCGDFGWAVSACLQYVQNTERPKPAPPSGYEDEAIAEENYYEYGTCAQGEGAVREDKEQEDGSGICKDEDARGILEEEQTPEGEAAAVNGAAPNSAPQSDKKRAKKSAERKEACKKEREEREESDEGAEPRQIPLADDLRFYERMRGEIERLLSSHPHEEALERAVENSRWAKINYGGKRFYVFGVISEDGRPAYICYGVPAMGSACPESLRGMAGFIPVGGRKNEGYWVMYQDARTGASVKLDSV